MARRKPRGRVQPDVPAAPWATPSLWAPWRSAYINAARRGPRRCIFCFGRLGPGGRRKRLVLHAGPLASVMLNRYPYNSGHLMIAPRRHVASPELLERDERIVIGELMALAVERLRVAMKPAGLNLGANLGRAAGAGFADHMHWHLVPRWEGDTNFMPVVGSTRVLSQHLEETFTLLEPLFKAIDDALS
ncbi:MAG: HIT family protein [Candidatus Binataceae bacterium]